MIVLGLTGSIGMGKSTLARQFAQAGAKVIAADALVHALLSKDGAAVGPVAALIPQALEHGAINREVVGRCVFNNTPLLQQLESILHPLVRRAELGFIARQERLGAKLAVLDIPLLFETGGEELCDATVVATAPRFLQQQRVLARPGMTEEKFASILARQLPDAQKRARADFVVHTGLGRAYSRRQINAIIKELRA